MATQSAGLSPSFRPLEQSSDSIFFGTPRTLVTDEEAVTKYATSGKIETLIKDLTEKGPHIASGPFGPGFYTEAPFKLKDKVCDRDVYGWKPGTPHAEHPANSRILILGAKKTAEGREYVYFSMSQDITPNSRSYIRKHAPSPTDTKLYVISNKTFHNYVQDLYPPFQFPSAAVPVASTSSVPSRPTTEAEYIQKLISITPLDSIIDRGEGEQSCKAIGQEIFDKYKEEAAGNSWAGKHAAVRICEAVISRAIDGSLRKQYIERAWDGIGDDTWRWQA